MIPCSIQDHWCLLVIDLEEEKVRFVDTLVNLGKEEVQKLNIVLKVWKKVLTWLPKDIAKCRTNFCRQGENLACGYYVGWFLEEECRRSLGELPFSRGAPNAEEVVKKMLQLATSCLPTEKLLQERLGSTVWGKSGGIVEAPAAPAGVVDLTDAETQAADLTQAAVKDVEKAVLKDAGEGCFPGIDMAFPLKDYEGDLEAWATDVEGVLTEDHKEIVLKVREKEASAGGTGCSACRHKTCAKCWWPKAVRYWRKLETASKFSVEEGYERVMKAKTSMKVGI